MPQLMPPQVSLRALREALGLTLDEVAERIHAQHVDITKFGLSNFEAGRRRASPTLLDAYARALRINPLHIRQDRELAALVQAWSEAGTAKESLETAA